MHSNVLCAQDRVWLLQTLQCSTTHSLLKKAGGMRWTIVQCSVHLILIWMPCTCSQIEFSCYYRNAESSSTYLNIFTWFTTMKSFLFHRDLFHWGTFIFFYVNLVLNIIIYPVWMLKILTLVMFLSSCPGSLEEFCRNKISKNISEIAHHL